MRSTYVVLHCVTFIYFLSVIRCFSLSIIIRLYFTLAENGDTLPFGKLENVTPVDLKPLKYSEQGTITIEYYQSTYILE